MRRMVREHILKNMLKYSGAIKENIILLATDNVIKGTASEYINIPNITLTDDLHLIYVYNKTGNKHYFSLCPNDIGLYDTGCINMYIDFKIELGILLHRYVTELVEKLDISTVHDICDYLRYNKEQ